MARLRATVADFIVVDVAVVAVVVFVADCATPQKSAAERVAAAIPDGSARRIVV